MAPTPTATRKSPRSGRLALALLAGLALFALVLSVAAGMAGHSPARAPAEPDLALVKSGPSQALPGAVITYTLAYSNQGDAPAEGVVVTDGLPAGVTYQGAQPSGNLAGGGVYTWYIGTVLTGTEGAGVIVLTATVAPTLTPGASLVNAAEITTAITETITTNNQATVTTTVVAADLSLSKAAPATALLGDELTYTLAYTNQGEAVAESVVLTDWLPVGVTYQDATPPGSPVGGGAYVWDLGAVSPHSGGTVLVTVTVRSDLADGALLINTAQVSTLTPDADANNNQAVAATLVQAADVGVVKSGPGEVRPNHALGYTLVYSNSGSAPAAGVRITDTLPLGMSYQGSAGPLPPPTVAGRRVVWDAGTLAPGAGGTLILTATVNPALPPGTPLVNQVEISTTTPEDVTANNTHQVTTTVIPDVPHELTLVAYPDVLTVGGETALVTATVRDRWGNWVADGTRVDFSVTGPGSVSPSSRLTADGIATTTLTSATTPGTVQVTAQVDSLSRNTVVSVVPGPPADLELEVFPPALTVGQMASAAAAVWDAYHNPVADGTVVTFATTLGAVIPETVPTTDGWAAAAVTSTVVGTATVSAATDGLSPRMAQIYFAPGLPHRVEVTADPPAIPVDGASTTIHAAVLDQFGNGVEDGYPVHFTSTLGTIAPLNTTTRGGEATATLTSGAQSGVAVVTATRGALVGVAHVTFLPADLVLTKTVTPAEAVPGQTVTFTISYQNQGAALARGVVLADELPGGLVNLAYVSSGAPITHVSGTSYTWQVADLAQGEGGVITITGQVDPSLDWPSSRTLFNRATINTVTAEDRKVDNQNEAPLVVWTADLYIGQDLRPSSSPQPGGELVFDVYYGNLGAAPVTGIRITDTLPAFTHYAGEYLFFAPGLQRITPNDAPIQVWEKTGPVGSNESFRLWLAIDPHAPGGTEAINTLEIATTTPEYEYANNIVVKTVTIQGVNLTVSKFGPPTVKPTELITYQITVYSVGTLEAQNTVLTDVLPSGVTYVSEQVPPSVPPSTGSTTVRAWSLGGLSPGSSRTIVLIGRVSPDVPAGTDLVNRVTVNTSTPESYLEDNQHAPSTHVIPDVPYTVTVVAREPAIHLGDSTVVTVTVTDEFGNRVSDGTGVSVTTTLGTITPTVGATVGGEVTATLRSGTVAGLAQVTASSGGRTGSTLVEFMPDPPYTLTLDLAPQVLTADGVSTATLVITGTDRFANLVADGTVVTLTAANATPIPSQVTTYRGVATATVRAGTVAGTAVVTATAGSAVSSVTLQLEPGPPGILDVTTSPPAILADGVATATLVVTVTDALRNPVHDGTEVRLSAEGVTVWPTRATTVDGLVVGGVQAGTRAGTAYITATAGSAVGVGTVQLLPGPPVTATMTAHPDHLVANGVATSTLVITATDGFANPVADGTLVHLAATGASVPSMATTQGGVARAVLTAGTLVGTAHVTATVGAAVATTTVRLDPGPPWSISITPSSSQLQADGQGSITLTIRVADRFDNAVADGTQVHLTTTLGTVGPEVVQTWGGWALAMFRAGTRSGEAVITARAGDAVGTVTVLLLPGPPHFVNVSADPPAIVADGVSTATLTVTVTDIHANPVSDGYQVHLVVSEGRVSPAVGLTQGGQVTARYTAGTHSGLAVVTATVDSRVGTGVVKLLPGPPAQVAVRVVPAVLPADGMSTAAVTITVSDGFGNPAADGTAVALTSTLSAINPTLATTTDGVATATLKAGVTLGTGVVTATAGAAVGMAQVEFVPGPPAVIDVTAWPERIPADGVSSAVITATVSDIAGHAVADGTWAFFATTLGSMEPRLRATQGGVVTSTLRAGTRSGTATVTVAVGAKSGTTTVELLPGPPADLAVTVEPARVWADGVSTATIIATVTDVHRNPVTDGTVVMFTTDLGAFPAGETYVAETMDGKAVAVLRAPPRPGVARVEVRVAGLQRTVQVTFFAGRLFLPLVHRNSYPG